MELQLLPNHQPTGKTNAAFIRGNTPEQWFREMNEWQVPLKDLTCFLLPEHKKTIAPGGLLVLFNNQVPAREKISHPYRVINDNLFIPVDAGLTPAMSPAEIKALLIWHVQVFHPSIGFVGFDREDELPLSSLLARGQAMDRSWDQAHPGMPPLAPLHTISVAMPEGTDLADLLNDGEEILPLSEIPGEEPRKSIFRHLIDWLLYYFLLLLLGILNILSRLRPTVSVTAVQPATVRSSRPGVAGSGKAARALPARPAGKATGVKKDGLRDKLRKLLDSTKGGIEDRRQSQLDRLLKMFDKDANEALKYAIPLAGNTPGRGAAPPASSLSEKDPNFNLGTMRGGGPIDTWGTSDDYIAQLTKKYEEEAAKALKRGDHRKAAYIYAHLLGDMHRAAAALEQGRFYHEAAAIYLDHLNQPEKAAICFEKGGLLLDAINIYKKLKRYEKTGDLYTQLSQEQAAQQYFQLAVTESLLQKNYLDAARVLQHKCRNLEEACNVLRDGWRDSSGSNANSCLTQYFSVAKQIDADSLADRMRSIYEKDTPETKQNTLTDVLLSFRSQMNPAAQQTSTDIIYEIISPQIKAGQADKLAILKKIQPDDKEVPADIYRFTTKKDQPTPDSYTVRSLQLPQDVEWMTATVVRKQLFFVGRSANVLYILRMTPQGDQKVYSWQFSPAQDNKGREERFSPYFSANDTSRLGHKLLCLQTDSRKIHLGGIVIPSEKPFGDKVIFDTKDYPAGYNAAPIGTTMNAEGDVVMIYVDRETCEMLIKKTSGASYYCVMADSETRIHAQIPVNTTPILGSGPFYFAQGSSIAVVGTVGNTMYISLPLQIKHLTAIDTPRGMLMAAITSKGCTLILNYRDDVKMQQFAAELTVRDCHFISDKYLLIAPHNHSTAIVYDVSTMTPVEKKQINTAAPVQFILPTGNPDEVVLVDGKGRITVHKID